MEETKKNGEKKTPSIIIEPEIKQTHAHSTVITNNLVYTHMRCVVIVLFKIIVILFICFP